MLILTRSVKKLIPALPLWSNHLQYPPKLSVFRASKEAWGRQGNQAIVYFPACISRVMGSYEGKEKSLLETFLSICGKAGIGVQVLKNVTGSCCSQIFSSKGYGHAYRYTANGIIDQLWESSKEGALPVVIDVSSCAYTLQQVRPVLDEDRKRKFDALTILDSVDFLHDLVLPRVERKQTEKHVVLHPVCSLKKMKTEDKLVGIAKHFARQVTVPHAAGCCGMAGDRGFLFPELTASATRPEALEVRQRKYDGYYSSTKTCEMALSEAVQENYVSILYLVDEAIDHNVEQSMKANHTHDPEPISRKN